MKSNFEFLKEYWPALAQSGETAEKLDRGSNKMLIDEQLQKAGWEADTKNLSYSKGIRPVKGKNIAISEWPTDSA